MLLNYVIVVDGRIVGTWKRTVTKNEVVIEATPFAPLNEAQTRAFTAAVERYSRFLGFPARLQE